MQLGVNASFDFRGLLRLKAEQLQVITKGVTAGETPNGSIADSFDTLGSRIYTPEIECYIFWAVNYFKGTLSAITAIFLAECVPGSWSMFRGVSQEKATGLDVALLESMRSPWFWILAISLFALFFAASRLGHKLPRILLFWIPTLFFSSLSLAMVALVTYIFVRLAIS